MAAFRISTHFVPYYLLAFVKALTMWSVQYSFLKAREKGDLANADDSDKQPNSLFFFFLIHKDTFEITLNTSLSAKERSTQKVQNKALLE